MKSLNSLLLAAGLLTLVSCKKSDDAPKPNPTTTQSGFVKGRVLDTKGRPLAGAKVEANSAIYYNNFNVAFTDKDGYYKIPLPTGPMVGAYYVRGHADMTMDGKTYHLPLFTEDDGTFMPEEGAVKNLSLKLSGPKTGNFGDDGFYGGSFSLLNHTASGRNDDVEFTLVPKYLIDGSAGETLTFHTARFEVQGVPIGRYTVSARDRSTGLPLKVRVSDSGDAYAESVTMSFSSNYYIESLYEMHVEVAD